MGLFKVIPLFAALVIICLSYVESVKITGKEFQSSDGNGECDTDLDCSNHGRCVNKDEEENKNLGELDEINGKCLCDARRDGKYCEKEAKVSRRHKVFARKPKQDTGEKRQLMFDNLKCTGLDPKELAEKELAFLIYNPRTTRYVRVSTDSPRSGDEKSNNFLVTDVDYRGESKLFKLESAGSDEYKILALDNDGKKTVGYVYVSKITRGVRKKSQRVMKSASGGDGAEYKFKFTRNGQQNGVYKIKNNDLTLYASTGGHNVKADNRGEREKSEEIWFQFNLKDDLDNKVETESTKKDAIKFDEEGIHFDSQEYANDNSEDTKVQLSKERTKTLMLSRLDKLTLAATGGLKGGIGNIGFTATGETSTTKQKTVTITSKDNYEITVKAKKKVCVKYSYQPSRTYDEEKLKITVKGKTGTLAGYKLVKKVSNDNIVMNIKEVELKEDCK